MQRTTIWLTAQQAAQIAKLAKKTGMKQSEIVRRFIDKGLEESKSKDAAMISASHVNQSNEARNKIQ